MKTKSIIFFILISFKFISISQTPANDSHWYIDWSDDFDTFNGQKWLKTNNCDHGGEAQLYLDQNVTTANGNLVIRLTKEDVNCAYDAAINDWGCGSCNAGIKHYTSGMVTTNPNNKEKYGYIEARIKSPVGLGFWPAFWTWKGDPTEEIDIFEMIPGSNLNCGSNDLNFVHTKYFMTTNFHNDTPASEATFCTNHFMVNAIDDYTNWHKFAIEWSPSKVIFYLDDMPIRIEQNDNKFSPANIIFNLALNKQDIFPVGYNYGPLSQGESAYMYVDYIKVYKLTNDCNTNLNVCSYNFSNHDNKVKNTITIGNGTCYNSLVTGDNVILRASKSILINGNFTVPVGAELYLDTNPCY